MPNSSCDASLVWCVDSPGFGGAEMSLMRAITMSKQPRMAVLHNREVCPELEQFFVANSLAVFSKEGSRNEAPYFMSGLLEANAWLARFPRATFILWLHHPDSNRWLQLALSLKKRSFVLVERSVPSSRKEFERSRLSIPLKRYAASRATVVVLNARTQEEHYRRLFGLQHGRIQVIVGSRPIKEINSRVAELRAKKQELLRSLEVTGSPLIVCVGRLCDYKAQSDLIRALPLVSKQTGLNPALALVGDGPDLESLKNLSQTLAPGQVRFAGQQKDATPWLAAADVYVTPSLLEGLSGALIEAMAAELPCVASDIPGNRELLRHEKTGLLVPTQNPEAIAAALSRLLTQTHDARKFADAALHLVASAYDENTEQQSWAALMEELQKLNAAERAKSVRLPSSILK